MNSTLRDLASRPRPLVCFVTTASFQRRSFAMSIDGLPNDMPNASACVADSITFAA
jgi:hypothetical protein